MTYEPGEGPITEEQAKAAVEGLPESPAPETAEAMDLDDPEQQEGDPQ